ncbi:glycosyltransferase family 2 protein [Epilithonimonas lactis]|uniref:Glycosyltransferase 2-like domain-containing protein n=1 Tax=Epilithonimonas lactis TaxID=421072 RepID=A0A085BL81_9FLAO|nr:glycosyltransferase family 2 protein [Epilithonimonas lactis]KFC23226.1 hypothetical protein IO89_01115 [Epilithonimonas lactis]SEQ05908.1 Glycosyl transferase family 2 [Epilithonimonas lactis]
MKTLTIFTPTYNRVHLLPRLYKALLQQSIQDFIWLVVDDGSEDNTLELLQKWKSEDKINIEFHSKENGGIHTAYNLGIEKCNTELFMCIDSDDFPPIDAVHKVISFWTKNKNEKYAGIIGLDYSLDGKPLKNLQLPAKKEIHIIELATKYNFQADTKMVHRTELLKKVAPMKVFPNEKNFNPIYLFLIIDQNYPLLILNENLCFVDYQETGMANNILNQYKNSPKSFAELRRLQMSLSHAPYSFVFRNAIHYISSCLFAKQNLLRDSPKRFTTFLAIPFGFLLYFYLRLRTDGE